MFEVGDKLLNGINHLSLSKVLFGKKSFQLFKERIYLRHGAASCFFNHTESHKAIHINLLTRDIKLLVGFFTSRVALEINNWIGVAIITHLMSKMLGFSI